MCTTGRSVGRTTSRGRNASRCSSPAGTCRGASRRPTHGGDDHREEAKRFCAAFPDNRVRNRPYDVLFGDGDFTCFVTRFTGTFTAPLEQSDETFIEPTGERFDVLYSTAARWKDGKIVEEYLFYDNGTFMNQIGLA